VRTTLLLNSTYEAMSFIDEKKAIKLLFKGKVETIATWSDKTIKFGDNELLHPAILRMKYFIKRNKTEIVAFSRKSVFKRDCFSCQYCGIFLTYDNITMDHIIPKKLGGSNSFLNCVAACQSCNLFKGDKTLEESGLKLLNQPFIPRNKFYYGTLKHIKWHEQWNLFIKN
jgi:5-methylcytosine-specific restriction endonuclease McrA